MKRLLGAGALLLAVTGTAGAVYLALPSGGEEEAVQAPQESTTPSPTVPLASPMPSVSPSVPADLPPAAEGYVWFVTPSNDSGLPPYAVQVPLTWTLPLPFFSNPAYFAPNEPTTYERPAIMAMVSTADDTVYPHAFQSLLPRQGGYLCGLLPDGQVTSAIHTWNLFRFTCPREESGVCEASEAGTITCRPFDPAVPFDTFSGRAAEARTGEFAFTIFAYQGAENRVLDAEFEAAINSFTLQ